LEINVLEELMCTAPQEKMGNKLITAKQYILLFNVLYKFYRKDLVWEFKLIKQLNILHKLKYVRVASKEECDSGDPANDMVYYFFDHTITKEESLAMWELETTGVSLGRKYDEYRDLHSEWFEAGLAMVKEDGDSEFMICYSQVDSKFQRSIKKGKYTIKTFAQIIENMEHMFPNANDE
jgi:hypothetical protein